MDISITHITAMGALSGAALAVWGLFSRFDKIYRLHLNQEFATKADIERLESKLDRVLMTVFKASNHR